MFIFYQDRVEFSTGLECVCKKCRYRRWGAGVTTEPEQFISQSGRKRDEILFPLSAFI